MAPPPPLLQWLKYSKYTNVVATRKSYNVAKVKEAETARDENQPGGGRIHSPVTRLSLLVVCLWNTREVYLFGKTIVTAHLSFSLPYFPPPFPSLMFRSSSSVCIFIFLRSFFIFLSTRFITLTG